MEPEPPEVPLEGLRLEARSATTLTGTVGIAIDSAPVVRLTMLDGNPAPGREIRFLVSGGGSIEIASQRTDTAGMASPGNWTLGTKARAQFLTARAEGVADVTFTAAVKPGRPATMAIVAGNHQTAAAGAPLPASLQVKLADQYGNPVPEEPVNFSVVLGSGTLAGDELVTDSLGFAWSGVWTLGSAGAQLVRTSAAGKEVLFEAFGCDDPCRGRDFVFTKGDAIYSAMNGVETPLLTMTGASEPAWSPDAQRLAFTVWDWWNETVDLYLMDAHGSNAALLASGFYSPSWSPDGRLLAAAGADGVYVINVEEAGTPPVLLAAGTYPAWSPDGTKIAFVEFNEGTSLRVINADGTAPSTLVSNDQRGIGPPSWSPDGQRIAFRKWDEVNANIFTVTAVGSGLIQLSRGGSVWGPAWSPDGSRIAFASEAGLVWLPADGSTTQPIPMVQGGYSLAWRP